MKHAGDESLNQLEGLLEQIRGQAGLKERKRGVFYHKSAAFLHFHEDPAGLFADLHATTEWERLPVNSRKQQRDLIAKVHAALQVK